MLETILLMLHLVPVPANDRAAEQATLREQQAQEFARYIDESVIGAPAPPKQWAALIVMTGQHETHFETRLVLGQCSWKRRECDAATTKGVRWFRARGAFQNHPNQLNRQWWEVANESIEAQVNMVNDGMRRAFNTCRNSGVPFPLSTIRAYAGSACTKPIKGEQDRMKTFERMMRVREKPVVAQVEPSASR